MPRKIPPFAAIRAFEAVARLGRHADAAQELKITTSAISHQVKALEAFLGVALFQRSPSKQTTMTPDGEALLSSVSMALDGLDAAFARYTNDTDKLVVSIHMFQSLANLWLIPKLPLLREVLPQLQIKILTTPEEISFSSFDVDLAIVFADKPPQDSNCIKLFDELIQPVCAPDYLKHRAGLLKIEDMLAEPLIQCNQHKDEWIKWFEKAELSDLNWQPAMDVDNRSNALQAAASGMGWAMDRRPYGEGLKQTGQLIAPFGLVVPTGNSYYLLTSYRSDASPGVVRVRKWLKKLCDEGF